MGLDTTHNCWHGPYSSFMRWRQWLNYCIMKDRAADGDGGCRVIADMGATRDAIERAWDEGRYKDQTIPLNVLMAHSDCDGEIPAAICYPLADALMSLMERHMPPRATYDHLRPPTERFIAGLQRAAAAGEPVLFH